MVEKLRNDFTKKPDSNIALFTLCTYYNHHIVNKTVNNFTGPNISSYCKKHSYDFYFLKDEEKFNKLPFIERGESNIAHCLFKFEIFLKLFEMGYDKVFYIDSIDILITNYNISLSSLVDDQHSLFFSLKPFIFQDNEGTKLFNINGGFHSARNTTKSKKFFRECIEKVKEKNKKVDVNENNIHDQFIFKKILNSRKEKYKNDVSVGKSLQQKFWYSNKITEEKIFFNQNKRKNLWVEGDFLIHLGVFCSNVGSKFELVKKFYRKYCE